MGANFSLQCVLIEFTIQNLGLICILILEICKTKFKFVHSNPLNLFVRVANSLELFSSKKHILNAGIKASIQNTLYYIF